MLEKLIEIYGDFDENTQKWISENLEKLGEENEQNFLKCLQEEHSRRQGKPDIYKLKKVLEKVLTENKTDFIICQKGKGHYQIVGYHTIITGDTTIVLELGKRMEG